LIDVLGYTPAGDGPLVDPFDALEGLPDGHPYERVGSEAVRDALEFFDDIAGDAYDGAHTDANALVPTHGGTVKPTARYPVSTAAGLASDDRDALLVGFETLPDFEAPLAASHLEAAGVPFEARGVTVQFPGIARDDAKITRYAHLLDHDESVATTFGETTAREALAETVRPTSRTSPASASPRSSATSAPTQSEPTLRTDSASTSSRSRWGHRACPGCDSRISCTTRSRSGASG